MGSIIITGASLLIGTGAAVFTVVGIVDSQTAPQGPSPASVSNTVIDYGTTP